MNRIRFDSEVRRMLFGGTLTASQLEGLTTILGTWAELYPDADRRWLAYVLATAHHETARTMQPIREFGFGRGKPYGRPDPETGHVYAGRGYVQLTWRENYRRLSDVAGVDLVADPDRALEPAIAARILCVGMVRGLFTGKSLADYFNDAEEDWRRARRIVNGLDQAKAIADYGRTYHVALRAAEL